MAFPLVPVAAVAGAAALVFAIMKLRGGGDLPPDLQGPFNDLVNHGTDPDAMEQVAVALDQKGFKTQAAMLRAKEAQLRGGSPAPKPAPAPQPAPGAPPAPAPPPPAPAPQAPAGPALPAQFMKVTTNDPPPSGDLSLRSSPLDSAGVIGAAEKDSIVTVKDVSADGKFIRVEALNPAGRRASATGWAHAAFLVPANPMKTSGRFSPSSHAPYAGLPYGASIGALLCGAAIPAASVEVRCINQAACAMRQLPTYASGVKALLPLNASVEMVQTILGPKVDPRAPGPGGWALVHEPHSGTRGWVPREWLA